jgi:hypothetical protein
MMKCRIGDFITDIWAGFIALSLIKDMVMDA